MRTVRCTLSSFGYGGVPAPAVQAYFYIPRIAQSGLVTFLIDTGASGSCLHGPPALYLQGYLKKQSIRSTTGIGGNSRYYHERAILVFTDDKGQRLARGTSLGIQKLSPIKTFFNKGILRLPNLLGRDILSRCEFRYDASNGNITMTFP